VSGAALVAHLVLQHRPSADRAAVERQARRLTEAGLEAHVAVAVLLAARSFDDEEVALLAERSGHHVGDRRETARRWIAAMRRTLRGAA
jgi:hypothetical protein